MKKKNFYKGFLISLLVLLFIGGAILVVQGQSSPAGDVDGSGSVTIVDALMVAQFYVGLTPAGFDKNVADVNCDSMVNIVDALLIAQYFVGLLDTIGCPSAEPPTPGPTSQPGALHTGNSTWFFNLGSPYGGCGIPQSKLDNPHFVALNVQDTPGDYTTFYDRPIVGEDAANIGAFNNGLNCGRWVRVTISDYCNGINDGSAGNAFCRDGSGWTSDSYNGATLDMIIADSCQDGNAWCRDDPFHVDLAQASLNQFMLNGQPVGDMDPDHYNNRQVTWQYIEAPGYTGDIEIAFIMGAQAWWSAIAVNHLRNGIHGVDYFDGSSWVKADMNSDMGQSYIIKPTVEEGTEYRIRVYDVTDQLINDGRVYNFSFPGSCDRQCSEAYTEVPYTIE